MQSTVTVTTQYTITVTQAAAVATTVNAASLLQNGSIVNGSISSGSSAQNGSGKGSNSSDSPLGTGVSPSSSPSSKGKTCSHAKTSGAAAASASAGIGGLYGNGIVQGSKYPVSTNASSSPSPDTRSNTTASVNGLNTTATMNYTSDADLHGQFWAGGMYVPELIPLLSFGFSSFTACPASGSVLKPLQLISLLGILSRRSNAD